MGKQWKQWETLFGGATKSLKMVAAAMKLRCLLLGRKAIINVDSILKKQRHYLASKGPSKTIALTKAMVFPVVMYGCESWTIKKLNAEEFIAFELWCWRRLLRVCWTSRWSNQSILKEISPEIFTGKTDAEAEIPILWPPDVKNGLHWKRPWCWGRLKARREGDNKGWDGWMASTTQWTWVWVNSGSWWWTGRPGVLQSVGSQRVRHD